LLTYNHHKGKIGLEIFNKSSLSIDLIITSNAYDYGPPLNMQLRDGKSVKKKWNLKQSGNWFDFSVSSGKDFLRRFAGRVETSKHGISDPAMALEI